ncbi:hypothetical protein ACFQX6_55530 [Streptosporangium lutulentum]
MQRVDRAGVRPAEAMAVSRTALAAAWSSSSPVIGLTLVGVAAAGGTDSKADCQAIRIVSIES